jgi:O-antigen chain-terminating methyltransferase
MDMKEEDVSIGADVDVRAIMAEIRAEVAKKKKAGLYPAEILQEFDAIGGIDGPRDDALQNALMGLRQTAGFSTAVTTASQMPVVAPVASSFKRVVRGSVRWYLTGIVQQIEAFGANVIHAIGLLTERLRRLEERSVDSDGLRDEVARAIAQHVGDLRNAVEATRTLAEQTSRRLDELEADVGGLRTRDRLALVERSLRNLREQLDAGTPSGESRTVTRDRSFQVESALDYVDFENQFRGSEEEIRARQAVYVEVFRDAPGVVVDLGCGRGEFLELLNTAGISSYGVDRHPDMVARSKEKGLDARQGDALEHLASVPPGTLDGIFSAQMIEHLEIRDVPGFFELAADALAPDGRLIVETINPESLVVFASAFYVDLGHLRPLHPLTLRFLASKTGFRDVRVEYFSPPPEDARPADIPGTGHALLDEVVEAVNENFRRVDRLVFGPQDYALIATR